MSAAGNAMGTKDVYMHSSRIDEIVVCEGVICGEIGIGKL